MEFLGGLNVASSGIVASRAALDLRTQNLVNQQIGGYKAKLPVLQTEEVAGFEDEFNVIDVRSSTKDQKVRGRGRMRSDNGGNGVKIGKVIEDQTLVDRVYDPSNPEADAEGYVEGSNVDATKEMLNIIELKKLFEMSAAAFNMQKSTIQTGLKIGEK